MYLFDVFVQMVITNGDYNFAYTLSLSVLILIGEKQFLQNFISSRDGAVSSSETRQKLKHTRRLPYTMTEKKDKKTVLYLLYKQQIKGSLVFLFHNCSIVG